MRNWLKFEYSRVSIIAAKSILGIVNAMVGVRLISCYNTPAKEQALIYA